MINASGSDLSKPESVTHSLQTRFTVALAAVAALVVAIPFMLAVLGNHDGIKYLGYVYNTDDHMVYAAWMRQAMEGRFFLDNRFTLDPQPGLTVHLYFWALGLLANFGGIVVVTHLARIALAFAFVILLGRVVRRLEIDPFSYKLIMTLAVFGGGIGFLVWHEFGQAFVRPETAALAGPFLSRLPIDVWQPEGFVGSSLLTSSLFAVSLCLILLVFESVAEASKSWKFVPVGALAMGLLMNIHSYDVLIIGLVLVGLVVMTLGRQPDYAKWTLRVLCICAGMLPAAIYFVYVLQNDPVFQARAATPTFSPNFRQIVGGYLLLIIGAAPFFFQSKSKSAYVAGAAYLAILAGLWIAAGSHLTNDYFLGAVPFVGVFIATLGVLRFVPYKNLYEAIFIAWALLSLIMPYFPGLFQRKLMMGASIPWAVIAGLSIGAIMLTKERSLRNLATTFLLILTSATFVRWVSREVVFAKTNVSNTTVHPAYLPQDAVRIIDELNSTPGRKVVLAMPGIPAALVDSRTNLPAPDSFGSPIIPDLNPILSGFTGAYTFAGHWSETPDYNSRRNALTRIYLARTDPTISDEFVKSFKPTYIVTPVPETYPELQLADLRRYGRVIVDGTQFRLIQVENR